MKHIKEIKDLLLESSRHIDEHGHHQFDMWEGKVCCIMGAPRMVSNESSYAHIIRDVLAHIGYDEKWNDKPGRTKEEVVAALIKSASKITPALLEQIYGPEWKSILDVISEVDSWKQKDYELVASQKYSVEYPMDYSQQDKHYLNGLASFLCTVMTSGRTTNSVPYKKYFDTKYFEERSK